jgi:hypothetical protein
MSSLSIRDIFRTDPSALTAAPAKRQGRVVALLAVFGVLSVADLAATLAASHYLEIGELNPVAATMLEHGSVLGVGMLKLFSVSAFAGIVFTLRQRAVAEWLSWGAVTALGVVVTLWCVLGIDVLLMFSRHHLLW